MNLIYITAQTPNGKGEQFIPPEIIKMKELGNHIRVIPLRPDKALGEGKENLIISEYTDTTPLINGTVLKLFIKNLFLHPIRMMRIFGKIICKSGSLGKIMKNIMVIPKGVYMGEQAIKFKAGHIHCHWASTPATAAYVASYISQVPWSFTAHRWDIYENNMINEKARTASLIRVINEKGHNDIIKYMRNEDANKCKIIHIGIEIEELQPICKMDNIRDTDAFIIAVPANLIEVKGHKYLIEAISKIKGEDVTCYFYGKGMLEEEISSQIITLGLQDKIILKGQIPHDELLKLYKEKMVDAVILPSINTDKGEHEGVPVCLMEAMANAIPVISTYTGGIAELLGGNAGILVEDKSSSKLSEAITTLIHNKNKTVELGVNGYNKVNMDFNLTKVCSELQNNFAKK